MNKFEKFKIKIKEDNYVDHLLTINRNHESLRESMKCKYCKERLRLMFKKIGDEK